MTPRNKKILFVCTGNTCRSPFAQAVCNRLAAQRGLPVVAESCGLGAMTGDAPCQDAVAAAAGFGYDISGHSSRPATIYLVEDADLICCMSQSHARALIEALPQLEPRVQVLGGDGVPDPFGQGIAAYEQAYKAIEAAVGQLLAQGEDANG